MSLNTKYTSIYAVDSGNCVVVFYAGINKIEAIDKR